MQSIRSFASAICSAYKWTHSHLVEFQYTEKTFFSKTLGYMPRVTALQNQQEIPAIWNKAMVKLYNNEIF